MKNNHSFIILILLMFLGCSRSQKSNSENPDIVHFAEVNLENEDAYSNQYRKFNNAHSGNYYSSIDSAIHYGAGYCKTIPEQNYVLSYQDFEVTSSPFASRKAIQTFVVL